MKDDNADCFSLFCNFFRWGSGCGDIRAKKLPVREFLEVGGDYSSSIVVLVPPAIRICWGKRGGVNSDQCYLNHYKFGLFENLAF